LLRVALLLGASILPVATCWAREIPSEFSLPTYWFLNQKILWPALAVSIALSIWLRARNWRKHQEAEAPGEQVEAEGQHEGEDVCSQEEQTKEIESADEGAKNGFTLVELLVVIAIISILAAIGASNYQNATIRAKVAACKSNLRVIESATAQYRNDFGKYPAFYRGLPGEPFDRNFLMLPMSRRLSVLTTPIRYITSVPTDPFPVTRTVDTTSLLFFDTFDYVDADSLAVIKGPELGGDVAGRTSGSKWRLSSPGPDQIQAYGGTTAESGAASSS